MASRRSGATTNANKFVISPFRQSVHSDPEYAQRTWETLRLAIQKINDRKTSELSFEELYRLSYNMVLHKHGDVLYNGLTVALTEHLASIASSVASADNVVFLIQLQTQWSWFKISLNHIRDILMYMDRTYVSSKRTKSVHDLGVALFRDHVIRNDLVHNRLVDTVLSKIDCERQGESIDAHLVRSVTRMLAELGEDTDGKASVYVNVFEKAFLRRTRDFYAREAHKYLEETTCSDYLRKAHARMQEEKARVQSYLDPQTGDKVRRVAEDELISKYMKVLVEMENSGLIWMLRNDKCYDLQLMYSLFRNVPNGEDELRLNLKNEVLERGTSLVNDPEKSTDPVALVSAVLVLKEKYDRILKIAFCASSSPDSRLSGDDISTGSAGTGDWMASSGGAGSSGALPPSASSPSIAAAAAAASAAAAAAVSVAAAGRSGASSVGGTHGPAGMGATGSASLSYSSKAPTDRIPDRKFVTAVSEAFERFVNSFSRSPEFISLYVDRLLRQDLKGTSDDEVEMKLDTVMTLFRYLHEKDVFERYYKQHLSKRLLSNRTTSLDAERSFISKLKNECGYLYTSKMETMFSDMRTSAETTEVFRMKVVDHASELHSIELGVSVLTTISWPITNTPPCNVPPEIAKCCSRYEKFYFSKHEGRRLTWQTQMASGEVRALFGDLKRQVDLAVSGYGVCILMLFNETDSLTHDEILAKTGIPAAELVRNLQSLAMGKHRVLTKEPKVREMKGTDMFSFNNGFTSKHRRVKIQMVSAQKENDEEKSETRSRIDEDRKPLIEAAIVRIMKARKVLEHQQLVAEVSAMLSGRFMPVPSEIKKRIESLVEREFLERTGNDRRSTYNYVS